MDQQSPVVEIGDPRDRRIEQLQHALDTRVVIEQAKGILSERFGLAIDDSFELLRQAARSHQLKVRHLAEELVQQHATPAAIIAALVRVGHPHRDSFVERAAQSEQLFADLNDALIAVHRETTWTKFVCECTNPLCTDSIRLSAESLSAIHEHPGQYVLKAGHEVDAVERVVDRIDGLLIVEKEVVVDE